MIPNDKIELRGTWKNIPVTYCWKHSVWACKEDFPEEFRKVLETLPTLKLIGVFDTVNHKDVYGG